MISVSENFLVLFFLIQTKSGSFLNLDIISTLDILFFLWNTVF